MQIWDSSERYGTVSRVLHWGIVLLVVWQVLSASSHFFFDDTAIEAFFWPMHPTTGFLILVFMVVRVVWALTNLSWRPASVSLPAKLGHVVLYLLLLGIPSAALLRQYGSGRAFEPLGIPVFPGFEGEEIEWMMAPANLLHGPLGWILFALAAGHVAMTFWRRRSHGKQDVLPRMWR